jgi:hypothetical protein
MDMCNSLFGEIPPTGSLLFYLSFDAGTPVNVPENQAEITHSGWGLDAGERGL